MAKPVFRGFEAPRRGNLRLGAVVPLSRQSTRLHGYSCGASPLAAGNPGQWGIRAVNTTQHKDTGHKSLDRSFTAPWHGPRPSWVLPAVLGELLGDHPDAHVQPPRSVLNKKERTCACGPLAVEISARDHPRHPSVQSLGYISYLFPGRIWFQTSAASGAQRQRLRIVAFMGYLQRSPPLPKGNRYRLPAWSWTALSEYSDRMASAAVPKE